MNDFKIGDVITNGSSAMRLDRRVDKDPNWKVAGWRGSNIGLESFGGNVGMSSFVPDYLLESWKAVPFDWTPVIGGALEERYVWGVGYSRLTREVRKIEGEQ